MGHKYLNYGHLTIQNPLFYTTHIKSIYNLLIFFRLLARHCHHNLTYIENHLHPSLAFLSISIAKILVDSEIILANFKMAPFKIINYQSFPNRILAFNLCHLLSFYLFMRTTLADLDLFNN